MREQGGRGRTGHAYLLALGLRRSYNLHGLVCPFPCRCHRFHQERGPVHKQAKEKRLQSQKYAKLGRRLHHGRERGGGESRLLAPAEKIRSIYITPSNYMTKSNVYVKAREQCMRKGVGNVTPLAR